MLHDRGRHGPVRIEIDLDDLRVDVGRRPVGLAGDRGVPRHGDVVLDRLDERGRNIGDHITRAEIGGQRLEPFDIDLELVAPRLRRHVHGVERRLAHDAVDGEAMARLKAPHRLLDIGIVDVVADRARIEIAGHREPRAQIGHARIAGMPSRNSSHLGHHRPAAARDDAVVSLDRASVVNCAVAGDNVGADAFGMWMVRDA